MQILLVTTGLAGTSQSVVTLVSHIFRRGGKTSCTEEASDDENFCSSCQIRALRNLELLGEKTRGNNHFPYNPGGTRGLAGMVCPPFI